MWKPITSCTNISAKECNITCHIDDCYHKHEVEVRASADGNHSSWTKSNSFTLFFDVDFGPPVFKLEANNGVLHITPSVNEPQCISKYIHSCFEDVTFDLLVKDHDKEASYKGIEKTLEINETKLLGNVCVIAKSFHFTSNKSSLISEPKCHFIHKEGLRNWYSILTASLVIIAIIAITVFTVHYKSAFVKRLPKLLDFSSYMPAEEPVASEFLDPGKKLSILTVLPQFEEEGQHNKQRTIVSNTDMNAGQQITASDAQALLEISEDDSGGGYTEKNTIKAGSTQFMLLCNKNPEHEITLHCKNLASVSELDPFQCSITDLSQEQQHLFIEGILNRTCLNPQPPSENPLQQAVNSYKRVRSPSTDPYCESYEEANEIHSVDTLDLLNYTKITEHKCLPKDAFHECHISNSRQLMSHSMLERQLHDSFTEPDSQAKNLHDCGLQAYKYTACTAGSDSPFEKPSNVRYIKRTAQSEHCSPEGHGEDNADFELEASGGLYDGCKHVQNDTTQTEHSTPRAGCSKLHGSLGEDIQNCECCVIANCQTKCLEDQRMENVKTYQANAAHSCHILKRNLDYDKSDNLLSSLSTKSDSSSDSDIPLSSIILCGDEECWLS
ncbi:interferon lambda receptor 1 isoform X2 [Protopterus annectens]|nr:interferon lambda receptor 1 isoform X2 [Protopterus annectens]XP_043939250.1 interferon lambda receptor 1 isoform X2 [Protopterus annectens]